MIEINVSNMREIPSGPGEQEAEKFVAPKSEEYRAQEDAWSNMREGLQGRERDLAENEAYRAHMLAYHERGKEYQEAVEQLASEVIDKLKSVLSEIQNEEYRAFLERVLTDLSKKPAERKNAGDRIVENIAFENCPLYTGDIGIGEGDEETKKLKHDTHLVLEVLADTRQKIKEVLKLED